MRVTYEDPAQLNEKQRLMKLFKEQGKEGEEVWDAEASETQKTGSSSSSKGKRKAQRKAPTRRSTRVSHG